jgi:hydrogenase nickel incorporation protein HypA/HybF
MKIAKEGLFLRISASYPEHNEVGTMHEVSIAMSILDIVSEEVAREHGCCVQELVIDVGALSGVVLDSLEFAMDGVKKDTLLEKADIVLNHIPGLARCLDCEREFPADYIYATCPDCEDLNITIVRGKELQIKKITFE